MQSERHCRVTGRLLAASLVATAVSLLLLCRFSETAPVEAASEQKDQDSLTFVVLGDPQLGEEDVLRPMIRRIKAEAPDFVLITGDCVMTRGSDPEPWDRCFDLFAPLYLKPNRLLYAIPGKHDMDGAYNAALEQWLRRWDLPGKKVFYSFNRGPVHVAGLMITRNALFRKWDVGGRSITQLQWLKEDLRNIPPAVNWSFVFQHEPGTRYSVFTTSPNGPGVSSVSGLVEPLAFKAGVDILFRGHQHIYQRTYPIDVESWRRDDRRGMVMITTGGGNRAALMPIKPEEWKGRDGHLYEFEEEDAAPRWFDAVIAVGRPHYCKVVVRGEPADARGARSERPGLRPLRGYEESGRYTLVAGTPREIRISSLAERLLGHAGQGSDRTIMGQQMAPGSSAQPITKSGKTELPRSLCDGSRFALRGTTDPIRMEGRHG